MGKSHELTSTHEVGVNRVGISCTGQQGTARECK